MISRDGIEEIAIKDLGVIAQATLPLGPGFTAITGETGAGKTMLVTALGLLLGERSDSAAVRVGSQQAWVEGRWRVPVEGTITERVRDAGGDVDEVDAHQAELVLTRSVSVEGRSRAVVGGRSAPVSLLADLAEELVVVHGQADQIRLRSAAAQREALDNFAGTQCARALAAYTQVFHRWRVNSAELTELVDDQDRRAREADDLRSAMTDIEALAPQPGEDVELTERAERLGNVEELRLAAAGARQCLVAEDTDSTDAASVLDQARRILERATPHDTQLGVFAESIANATYVITDVAAQLSSYLAALDDDGSRDLEMVQERRAQLARLMRTYGPTLDDVIQTLETGSQRLSELDGDSDRIEELRQQVDADHTVLMELADEVTSCRREAGERLADAVSAELSALAMPDAAIRVEVTPLSEFTVHGRDHVAILLQPHPGAEPRPLGKGASGGELSRVMLAIEVVVARNNPVPTFVFDEIDAGVGGAAASEIGRRLARLARNAQVIVVTHLAQVAAFATNHLSVVKDTDGSVTTSSVRRLADDERIAEMARLLSGLSDSESALAHARELVALAENEFVDDKL